MELVQSMVSPFLAPKRSSWKFKISAIIYQVTVKTFWVDDIWRGDTSGQEIDQGARGFGIKEKIRYQSIHAQAIPADDILPYMCHTCRTCRLLGIALFSFYYRGRVSFSVEFSLMHLFNSHALVNPSRVVEDWSRHVVLTHVTHKI